jgi:hypothetical protein
VTGLFIAPFSPAIRETVLAGANCVAMRNFEEAGRLDTKI